MRLYGIVGRKIKNTSVDLTQACTSLFLCIFKEFFGKEMRTCP